MKRIKAFVTAAVMLFSPVGFVFPKENAIHTSAESCVYVDDLTFIVYDDHAVVQHCGTSAEGTVSIPSLVNGLPVTKIESNAFSSCKLDEIRISDSVSQISQNAFYRAEFTSIYFGSESFTENKTEFDFAAELPASVRRIEFSGTNPLYTSVRGAVFNKEITELIFVPAAYPGSSFSFPEGVTKIGRNAFQSFIALKNITIPESVTEISEGVFGSCNKLTAVSVSEMNPSYCDIDGVLYNKNHTYLLCWPAGKGGNAVLPDSVIRIGDCAFKNCSGVTGVMLPDSIESIGDEAFYLCSGLTEIAIPDGMTTIGISVFEGCSSLIRATIPDSVTSIGDFAFALCTNLTDITIPDSVTTIGISVFEECSSLTSITIPDSITSISDSAFTLCSALTEITIPNSVTSIGEGAFFFCKSLTGITITDSVTSIGERAFFFCSALTSITIPDSVTEIGNLAFPSNPGFAVYGNSDSCVEQYAIAHGYSFVYLDKKTICNATVTFTRDEFDYTGESIEVDAFITVVDGDRILKCGTDFTLTYKDNVLPGTASVTIQGTGDYRGEITKNYRILDTVDGLCFLHFQKYETIARVIYCDTAAEAVRIPAVIDGVPVTGIDNSAFSGCGSNLKSVTIPDSVTGIGEKAFLGCEGLSVLLIPDSVTVIGGYAFSCCTGLTGISLPDSLRELRSYTFASCTGLTELTIPDSVIGIGDRAIAGCTALKNVTIGKGVINICDYAFTGCESLTSILIPDNVHSIGPHAFNGCNNLTIKGSSGSYAEEYAMKHGIPFIALDSSELAATETTITTTTEESSTTATETTASAPLIGDFSGNGKLNISDAVLCIRYLAEDNTISAKTKALLNPEAADFDGDGTLTMVDVSKLLTYLAEQGVQP